MAALILPTFNDPTSVTPVNNAYVAVRRRALRRISVWTEPTSLI